MAGGLDDLLDDIVTKDVRKQFRANLVARGNTPDIRKHFILKGQLSPTDIMASETLWVVDRILEWQTVPQFLTVVEGEAPLPTGETMGKPLGPDWHKIAKAYSDWAPPPFNAEDVVPSDRLNELSGSREEPDRMQLVSKELQAMKRRLWEGIMPLSARRWREKQLYDPENFSGACRMLSMVVNVFWYLNLAPVQAALRETFVLMDGVLRTFEDAMNAKRALEKEPPVEISKKWHQFIFAKYAVMVNRSHGWVMDHVQHMKSLVLEQLEVFAASGGSMEAVPGGELFSLYDKWQDLGELSAMADNCIFMPMDGYDGSELPPQPEYKFRTQPLRVAVDLTQRIEDYHQRRGHLLMKAQVDDAVARVGSPPSSQREEITKVPRQQEAAQLLVRAELRGEPVGYEKEPWVTMVRSTEEWGFVVYRTCHSCSDDDWASFREKFDADQADWGAELAGAEALRGRSKLHWLDARDLGVDDGDLGALRSSFRAFAETEHFPSRFATDMFLVADEASVASYLTPQPEGSSPPGDAGGFICAVDARFDPAEGAWRPDESPGYPGTLKILGSLLWDDISALIASHASSLEGMWPLAMNHPAHIYVGPVVSIRKDLV
ncbi:hypothetical protein GGR56DRAFT_666094 [Xylariaceae sp. FL0804]|nr:hypothetical protein GGR56DRAFT_666094 [Xylariaceae sp. FL0804]